MSENDPRPLITIKPQSFWAILKSEKCDKFRVPIIQRDYVQGRKHSNKASKVRRDFLKDLFKALTDGTPICLNFIYGATADDKSVELIDGQQRFTTLFLLHWYLAVRATADEGQTSLQDSIKTTLRKFTYETRESSKNFFEKLCGDSFDCRNFLENVCKHSNDVDEDKNPIPIEAAIKDMCWFRAEWAKDPTVDSALSMLNAIHSKADAIDVVSCFNRLVGENPPITINVLSKLVAPGTHRQFALKKSRTDNI